MKQKETSAPVTVGNVTVRVDQWGDGRWWVRWREEGAPHKRPFRTLPKARALARTVATRLNNGLPSLADLTATDRQLYLHACKVATDEGFSLAAALEDWQRLRARARTAAKLPPAADLAQRLVDGLRHHKVRPRSHKRCQELVYRLRRFTTAFPDLGAATRPDIERYLLGLKTKEGDPIQPKTHDNHLSAIMQLYQYAVEQELWPVGQSIPCATLPMYYLGGIPVTFSPEVLRAVLAHTLDFWLPWVALGAFAGLRPTEAFRLEWEHVRWKQKMIAIPKTVAQKVGTARLVPLKPNLVRWLAPWRHAAGRLYPQTVRQLETLQTEFIAGLCDKIPGFTWTPDVLRHSAISYRLAETQNMHQVEEEFGTSKTMVKRFYNDPKTPAEARAWYAIAPARPIGKNIIPIAGRR